MKRNLYSLYAIKAAKWFNLVMPTIVLFYQSNGMRMQDILFLKSIYSLVIVLFEIPSGYYADAWGRKKTLIAGSLLGFTGFLIYSVNEVYAGFVVAEMILGLGHSFISGADSAMLFDTLQAEGKAMHYMKHEGRITAGGNFAEALAGITGGLLATISLRTPFYFQAIVAASAIPAALLLKEPSYHKIRDRQNQLLELMQSVRTSLAQNRRLLWVLLYSSFTGTATLTFAWFVQPYFKAAALPLPLYGVLWTFLNLSVGTMGLFAYRVEEVLGQNRSLVVLLLMISIGYFLAGSFISIQAMGVLFFFYAVRGVATPILKEYVNRYCESKVRATILSLRNFIIRINFAVVGPLLGWVADNYSLNAAFWMAGVVYLIASGVCVTLLLFSKKPTIQGSI